jgi:hypothetical protein
MEVATPHRVALAHRTDAVWSNEQIGISGRLSSIGLGLRSGAPVLAFFDGTALQYVANGTPTTVDSVGETGDWPSLAVTSGGAVMVSFQRCYYDRPLCNDMSSTMRRDLRFAWSATGDTWSVETVEGGSMESNSGFYTDMVLLGGAPVIAYFNRAQSMVRVARHPGGSFGNPAAWTIVDIGVVHGGDSRVAIAQSADGKLGLSFFDPAAKDLFYSESADGGATWSAPDLVDRLGDVGSMSDIAFDSDPPSCIMTAPIGEKARG